MCLVSENKKPFIAKRNITCYKIIRLEEDNCWSGVFQSEDTFSFGLVIAKGTKDIWYDEQFCSIRGGFFHAFLKKKFARELLKGDKYLASDRIRIVKCIIPKGNEYYISEDGEEICSPSMMVCNSLEIPKISIFKKVLNKLKKLLK